MFAIENTAEGSYPILHNNDNLFHQALKMGQDRYHVQNDKGEDFDLVLRRNRDSEGLLKGQNFLPLDLFPEYEQYDETDTETIWIQMLADREKIVIEEINEYTVAIVKVVLNFTDLEVITDDERISWFFEPNERIKVVENLPEYDKKSMYWVRKNFYMGIVKGDVGLWDSINFFHNLFFMQALLNGRSLKDFKYVSFELDQTSNGIGQVLSILEKFKVAFSNFGLKVNVPGDKIGSFDREIISKYFSVDVDEREDSNDSNTLAIPNFHTVYLTHFIFSADVNLDETILSEDFKRELDEYYEGIFRGHKTLGVLIRGTDYIVNNLGGHMKMASAELMIPKINEWFNEGNYDRLFLATEDADILDQMREEYGSKLIAIAQTRKRISDFGDSKTLLELQSKTEDDFDTSVEDTLANYFYALYILSKCDSFMASGWCNGFDIVRNFNHGKFDKVYKFEQNK